MNSAWDCFFLMFLSPGVDPRDAADSRGDQSFGVICPSASLMKAG